MRFDELRPAVLADVRSCVEGIDGAHVDAMAGELAGRSEVFLLGTGRSGKVLDAMAIRLGHLGIAAHAAGCADCPAVGRADLVLVGTGSGATPAVVRAATAASQAGATLAVITAAPDSPVARLARTLIHIPAPVTPGDGSTGLAAGGTPHTLRSLFEECLMLTCDAICRMVQDRLGLSTDDMQARHAPDQ